MSDTLAAFASKLAPVLYDKQEASARRKNVESALADGALKVHHLFESGSWTHGTSLAGKSDVDYMAWAISARPSFPSSALRAVKSSIEGCDWKISRLSVDSPAVSIAYYTAPNIEIVPAWYKEEVSGFNVFWIPGRGDQWILTAPHAHLAYVNSANDRLGKKVKPLVRLLKAWKYHVDAPVSSFYMEIRTSEYSARESTILYAIDLRNMFCKMISEELRDMNDPQGLVGRIPACSSNDKRERTISMMRSALANLELADEAEKRKDAPTYWLRMSHVFGNDFPWPDW